MTERPAAGRRPYGAKVLLAPSRPRTRPSAPALGLAGTAVLVVAALAVPPMTGWSVHPLLHGGVAPLAASWDPRLGDLPATVAHLRGLQFEHPVPVKYEPAEHFKHRIGSSKPRDADRVRTLSAST